MFQLRSTDSEGQVLLFPLFKSRMTIGRDPSNDIVLNDSDVSRWHALISWQDKKLEIRDMQSTNGVFVNNVRIHDPVHLKKGNLIILGSNLFVLSREEIADEDLSRTISISSEEVSALYEQSRKRKPAADEPMGADDAFDKTIVRDKHEMMECAFEKKLQIARFPRLEVQSDTEEEACYLLAMPVFRIGRAADCHLRIKGSSISGHHAEIRIQNTGNILHDMESENGTMVNGRRVNEQKLTDTDVIELPNLRLVYRHEEGLGGRFTDFLRSIFKA